MRYFSITILILLSACAQINMLSGGVDDTTAPTIDSAKTVPFSGQTNFEGTEVRIKFNEYIILNKPNDNIIITPRPTVNPTISSRNKTLIITFNEALLDNTTYTISFNRAISDITEKNDSIFQYVFSTGDYIDSLSLSGRVTDAYSNKGSENFLIALYPASVDASFDSIPYKTKPTYIGQSDQSGDFRINYLKDGVYYVYAINDKNKNLLLESDEDLAFLEEKTVLINEETRPIFLKSFTQKSALSKILKTTFSAPGKLELIFSNEPDSFAISTSTDLLQEETGKKDSLIFWLAQNPTPKMKFAVEYNDKSDTLKPLFRVDNEPIKSIKITTNLVGGKILPDQNLEIMLSEPISKEGINKEGFRVMKSDSSFVEPEFEIKNLRTLVLTNRDDKPLTVMIDSAALLSIYGTINNTAQTFVYEHYPESHYGSLIVNTDSVFSQNCIIYLLNGNGIPVDTIQYAPKMSFDKLPPGDYQLQLIIDSDNNGQWTSGSLREGIIPEKIIYFNEPITVKSKWEKEVDWLLKQNE